jgi:hypothetical protein
MSAAQAIPIRSSFGAEHDQILTALRLAYAYEKAAVDASVSSGGSLLIRQHLITRSTADQIAPMLSSAIRAMGAEP